MSYITDEASTSEKFASVNLIAVSPISSTQDKGYTPTEISQSSLPTRYRKLHEITADSRMTDLKKMLSLINLENGIFVAIFGGVIVMVLLSVISIVMWKTAKRKQRRASIHEYSDSLSRMQSKVEMCEDVRQEEAAKPEVYYENLNRTACRSNSIQTVESSLTQQHIRFLSEETHSHKNRDTPDGTYELPDVHFTSGTHVPDLYSYADPNELLSCSRYSLDTT